MMRGAERHHYQPQIIAISVLPIRQLAYRKIDKDTIAMKISHKLVSSFVGVSLLTGIVGTVSIAQTKKIAETLAIAEAEHVAEAISTSITYHSLSHQETLFSKELQDYVMLLHRLQHRDIEVVNRQKQIMADVITEDVGTVLEHDEGNEVYQTMQDGIPRTFLEKSAEYPQGIKLVAIPLKVDHKEIVGSVILEWSSLYDEAITKATPTMLVIGITSLSCIILAVLVGLQISSSIAKPLQSVTAVAQEVTQLSNFDLQAPVTTRDETGILALSLNHLIQRVKALLMEKEQHANKLQQTLNQLHATQMHLVQTEKMSSLGQLVAGVAHEINNPVNFIHGNITHIENYAQDLLKVAQVYQAHYPNPPQTLQTVLDEVDVDFVNEDLIKLLKSIKVGTNRIRDIVLSLRNFSRLDEAEFKAVDIHEGIDNTLVILRQRLKAKAERPEIQVLKDYSQLPLVECYAGQLNQVFMNLLSNAIDACEEFNQGKSFEEINSQPNTIQIRTYQINYQWVAITVTDNGSGIADHIRSRLFEPFFTTKTVGKGTGLGLSISYQIVTEKHGGKLWCDSTPDQGTKFVIEIPVQQINC